MPLGASGTDVPMGPGIEVMPVADYERWRDAFLEGQKADHAAHERLREAAHAVVSVDCELHATAPSTTWKRYTTAIVALRAALSESEASDE